MHEAFLLTSLSPERFIDKIKSKPKNNKLPRYHGLTLNTFIQLVIINSFAMSLAMSVH